MSKILVTGATGFIGANLVRRLAELGNEVTVLLRKDSDCSSLINLNITKVIGDILDIASVKKAMKNCEFVYHVAGYISFHKSDYENLFNINVTGTKNIVKGSMESSVKKLVYTSACAVFGISEDKHKLLNEEAVYNPTKNDVYAHTKKLAEEEIMKGCEKGLNAVIVNPSTVYGRGDRYLNSGLIIKLIYSNKFLIAPPGGTSVISVDDVVDGHMLAMEKGVSAERYILSNETMEFTELYRIIAEVIGQKRYTYKLPGLLYYPSIFACKFLHSSQITSHLIRSTFKFKFYDSSNAREKLGWNPKINFPLAISQALDYYINNDLI